MVQDKKSPLTGGKILNLGPSVICRNFPIFAIVLIFNSGKYVQSYISSASE